MFFCEKCDLIVGMYFLLICWGKKSLSGDPFLKINLKWRKIGFNLQKCYFIANCSTAQEIICYVKCFYTYRVEKNKQKSIWDVI